VPSRLAPWQAAQLLANEAAPSSACELNAMEAAGAALSSPQAASSKAKADAESARVVFLLINFMLNLN
jgi:hypothetical protein